MDQARPDSCENREQLEAPETHCGRGVRQLYQSGADSIASSALPPLRRRGYRRSMTDVWEPQFEKKGLLWGHEPTRSARAASDTFAREGLRTVLIPGVGYGRNAVVFLERGMSVTGIEISKSAIHLARAELGLDIDIHHGSVTDMPFDAQRYDGVFCYGLIYLLDAPARAKLVRDCWAQLAPGGVMIFTVIAKEAPMYGRGTELGKDWYEVHPGVPMFFYDADSVQREFGDCGVVEHSRIDEPVADGVTFPFFFVTCKKA